MEGNRKEFQVKVLKGQLMDYSDEQMKKFNIKYDKKAMS